MAKQIDQLIINSPYAEPQKFWTYLSDTQEFELKDGRREAGYYRTSQKKADTQSELGEFYRIELVNAIRPRVKAWREAGYPNVTRVTKELLKFWHNPHVRRYQSFFCQMEAVETAIWLTEASDADKQGIEVPKDAELVRWCFKLATGTGKTVVMSMLIAWQVLNKLANPKDTRFTKYVLIVAPGITVKDRLQVLLPEREDNFYEAFGVVPPDMWQDFLQGKILITNWHNLAPIREDSGPKVVKKGPESNEAFVKRVLSDFNGAQNILVLNDEAHHCHRPDADEDISEEEKEEATVWVTGLDRINSARGILNVFDLSATPFKPTGKNNRGELLFPWIVSDFGLYDAIEAGLVKTPKIAVRDDAKQQVVNFNEIRPQLFHIYPAVKEDLNRKDENAGLPDLVRNAVSILAADWMKEHEANTLAVPPVMISICNNTSTSLRLYNHLIAGGFGVPAELQERDKILRIDQDALNKLESDSASGLSKSQQELVAKERERFNTVGKDGKPGADVRAVIGVNMLSEGWDANNVTHILGLRAFTSQLLCEQVVGRGLRRMSYDTDEETGLFTAEYVTVFGVPFTILPVEGTGGEPPKPPRPKTRIEPIQERVDKEIRWPNVIRIERKLKYYLTADIQKTEKLILSAENSPTLVEVAPVIEGRPDFSKISSVSLDALAEQHRFESELMRAVAQLVERNKDNWEGDNGNKFTQIYNVIEKFIESDRLEIKGPKDEPKLKRILLTLNMQKLVEHIQQFIHQSSAEEPVAIFDQVRPTRSTRTSAIWYTSKPVMPVQNSQISHIVSDSEWEARLATVLEQGRIKNLVAWAKNDHLGFEIHYVFQGEYHTYYPDFIIKLENDRYLIVEVKGIERDKDKAKWNAAQEWVTAINATEKSGTWSFSVLKDPDDIYTVLG